jgi:predicted outer membrane repeat protein
VQAGIDSAAAGDTVLVLPGAYGENLIMNDGVVLLGRDGWSATKLGLTGAYRPVITCLGLGPGTVIEGFQIEKGRAFRGGGVFCYGSSVEISSCRFFDNYADSAGGAIACIEGSDADIHGNVFDTNRSVDLGGAILCDASGPSVKSNSFARCRSKYGGAISCVMAADPLIAENQFSSNHCYMQGGAIHCRYDCVLTVDDNVMLDNTAGGSGGGAFIQFGSSARFRRNIVARNIADHGGGIHITGYSQGYLENNTIHANRAWGPEGASGITAFNQSHIDVYRCIVSSGATRPGISCEVLSTATLDCNCVWGNTVNYSDCTPGPRDFSECPSFCYADFDNYNLCDGSPCAPGNHPGGYDCGLIGARGVGCSCGPTRTEATSWGAIKAMYR